MAPFPSLWPRLALNHRARIHCYALFLHLITLPIKRKHEILSLYRSSADEDNLLKGINEYRASLNLTALVKNENADCFADEMADQFNDQKCSNTTGSNTVPGMEPDFENYPKLLSKCHLNISDTKDGMILPACVPDLVTTQLLSNYTQSQYSQYLNDSKYTGVGFGTEDDWMVVVLTTSTPGGSFATYNAATLVSKTSLIYYLLFLLVNFFVL